MASHEPLAPSDLLAHRWYARPVLFVADLARSLPFYLDQLGFVKNWHEGDGKGTVCQVSRSECEIILCQHDTRRDKGRLFIELTAAAEMVSMRWGFRYAAIAGIDRDCWAEPASHIAAMLA